jgi:hypothetical protein
MTRTTTRSAVLFLVLLTATQVTMAGQPPRAVKGTPAVGPILPSDPFRSPVVSGAAVTGTVASVQGSIITLNSGGAAAIRIDAAPAKFLGEARLVTLADVKAGVRITAYIGTTPALAAGAALPAQLITIEDLPGLVVTGPLQAINVPQARFTVLGITLTTDATTSFSSAFPFFAPIKGVGDLAVGQTVNVSGEFAGGAIVAKRVQLLTPVIPITTTLNGTVKSISATAWILTGGDGKDVTVTIDGQTKILGSPKAGDQVQVIANVDTAHNYVAVLILRLP